MDALKPLSQICQADPLNEAFLIVNRQTEIARPMEIADVHRRLSEISICEDAPEDVHRYFNSIRNLYIYGWFHYPIFSLGGTLAFTLMEMGLRIRLGYQDEKRSPGLSRLLAEAIKKELLVDQGFTAAQIDEGSEPVVSALAQSSGKPKQEYCAILLDSLPYLRNTFLHPAAYSNAGSSGAFTVLRTAAELINQLFQVERE